MRKVIYGVGASLDGYIARPDGSLDFLHLARSDYSMWPFFKTIDVGLMGRKTYEAGVRMSGGKLESTVTFSRGPCLRENVAARFLCKTVPRKLWTNCAGRRAKMFGWRVAENWRVSF
jgi:hypothetical protein